MGSWRGKSAKHVLPPRFGTRSTDWVAGTRKRGFNGMPRTLWDRLTVPFASTGYRAFRHPDPVVGFCLCVLPILGCSGSSLPRRGTHGMR